MLQAIVNLQFAMELALKSSVVSYCGEEMVICDAVNIEYNNNYIRGYCLNCDNDTTVYKCPKCGQFINAELFDKTKCHEGFCSVFE